MKHSFIKMGAILLALLCLITFGTAAPIITSTGDIGDWGLEQLDDPSYDWSVNETWIPLGGISYVVEDNFNPLSNSPYSGVHILGTGPLYNFYNEPQVNHKDGGLVWEPFGYEQYDLEALYFTQDNDNIYIAIITSIEQTATSERMPGDLALDFGDVSGEQFNCEYGIKLNTYSAGGKYNIGDIVYLPLWEGKGYIIPPGPDIIIGNNTGGGVVGQAIVHYNKMNVNDEGYPNYFIEVSIPKSTVGVTGQAGIQNIHYYDNCLNDHFYVPEFPAFSLLIGMLLGLTGIIYLIKSKNHNN